MVRVCEDTLEAKGRNKAGIYMDDNLKKILDNWAKNVTDDWDFLIVISGEGQVRVGKSVLAQQIGYYWSSLMKQLHGLDIPFNVEDNIIFNGDKLIKKGNELGEKYKYSCLIFDEAGADLEAMKVMRRTTQDVKDFLRECGQYNFLTILVLPEFFDLPKGIAITRSDLLLNVKTYTEKGTGKFLRGYYDVYGRKKKKWLYIKGKKGYDYSVQKKGFHGRFYNRYCIDEAEYRQAKIEALKKREETNAITDKHMIERNVLFDILHETGLTQKDIIEKMKDYGVIISRQLVSVGISRAKALKYNKIKYKDSDMDGEEASNDGE